MIKAIKVFLVSLVMVMALSVNVMAETEKLYDIPVEGSIQMGVVDMCYINGVEPEIIFAISKAETKYQQEHYSGSCKGIMQVNVGVHSEAIDRMELDYKDIYDNYLIGLYVYKQCLADNAHDTNRALMAYNGGQSYADKMHKQGVRSTKYTREVMEEYTRLKSKDEIDI